MPATTPSPCDSGAQLRALYEPQGGTGQIFSSKVNDYSASRPDYPAALFDALRTKCNLHPGAVVADIGAGTGLLTLVFSRSYMPPRDSAPGQQASQDVRTLFQQLASGGTVAVRYTTVAMLGRPV